MLSRKKYIKFLVVENLIILLLFVLENIAVGDSRDLKNRVSGLASLIQENEEEVWRDAMPSLGPFENPDEDFRNWISYINSKSDILHKRIAETENRLLLLGLSRMGSLSIDGYRKVRLVLEIRQGRGHVLDPSEHSVGDIVRTNSSEIIKDNLPVLRRHLEMLKNWSAYLEDIKTSWYSEAPMGEVLETMSELERHRGTTSIELAHLNSFLLKGLRRAKLHRKNEKPKSNQRLETNCNNSRTDAVAGGDAWRQMQKNLSETFLYRNITIAEVNQMSKIVDFVERYRGNVRNLKIFDPEKAKKFLDSKVLSGRSVATLKE